MPLSPRLTKIILAEFQKTLRKNYESAKDLAFGKPPKLGYVEHVVIGRDHYDIRTHLEAWEMTLDSITPTPLVTRFTKSKIDGMFYERFYGWFEVEPDSKGVSINWQTGPRSGRGFRHPINMNENGVEWLGRGALTWVS